MMHLPEDFAGSLPRPLLCQRPNLVAAYWRTWEMAVEAVEAAPDGEGTVLASPWNTPLFQWDVALAPLWLRYAPQGLPEMGNIMAGHDLFYRHAREDGALPLGISFTGKPLYADEETEFLRPDAETDWEHPALVLAPPPLEWAEWELYQATGRDERFRAALQVIGESFDWLLNHRTRPEGYFFWTPPGGRPSPLHGEAWAWADLSCQAAFSCELISNMALYLDQRAVGEGSAANYLGLKELVNDTLWDELREVYLDLDADRLPLETVQAGAFWALQAGVAEGARAEAMVRLLRTYRHFGRPNPVPTLSGTEKWYSRPGARWRGGVWPPYTYLVCAALDRSGEQALAHEIALRHGEAVAVALGNYDAFHEHYAPDAAGKPGQGAREGFNPWNGLSTVALLLEQVIGIKVDAPLGEVHWRLNLEEDHGVENLRVGDSVVDLRSEFRDNKWHVTLRSRGPAEFHIRGTGAARIVDLPRGGTQGITVI